MMKTINANGAKLFFLLLLVSACTADDTSTTDVTTEASTVTDAPTTVTDEPTTTPPPPPPPTKFEHYDFKGPLNELRGSYTIKNSKHNEDRPGWASVWTVNEHERSFGVYFWPPKYCHAIYLCAVKAKTYDGLNKFDQFDCDSSYVKFYPHIRKIHFKADAQAVEVEKFYVEGSLEFQQGSDKSKYNIRVFNEEPVDEAQWAKMLNDPAKYTDLEWDLKDKDLLILTNSRMCEVNKPGMGGFAPIFNAENSATHAAEWPKWLPDTKQAKQAKPTLTLAATANSKKTVDLLAFLKNMKPQKQLAKINQQCSNFEKVGVFGARKPVHEHSPHISTASYYLFQPQVNVQGAAYEQRIEFEMSNCQWIRFWASEEPIDNYATAMKPEDTLDVFIQEGFYIPPDSNEPVPLPDIQLMNKLKLTILQEPGVSTLDEHELIEIAFGYVNEKYLFHQFFRSKPFGKKTFKLHMIRSPRCESNIVIDGTYRQDASTELVNLKDVQQCEFHYLTDS